MIPPDAPRPADEPGAPPVSDASGAPDSAPEIEPSASRPAAAADVANSPGAPAAATHADAPGLTGAALPLVVPPALPPVTTAPDEPATEARTEPGDASASEVEASVEAAVAAAAANTGASPSPRGYLPAAADGPPRLPPGAAPPRLHGDPQPLRFHGETQEFFRIWIVNTLLTLLTFGIFAAWAKVRRRRYFRGNTELLGHRFDYTADPRRLLIGNAVVALLFLGYAVVGAVYPPVAILTLVVAGFFLPWIIVRSASFNAANTVYRGLHFRFHPGLARPAFLYFVALPGMTVFTLGLLYPRWEKLRREWLVSSHRYGTAFFRFNTPTGEFFIAYLLGGLIVMGPVMALALGVGAVVGATADGGAPSPATQQMVTYVTIGVSLFFSYIARHFIYARLFNAAWNHTQIDEHRFQAQLPVGRWLKLQLVNLGAILLSAGLLYPWAAIRSTRFAVSCLSFVPGTAGLDRIEILESRRRDGALGDTAAEFAGIDFGL